MTLYKFHPLKLLAELNSNPQSVDLAIIDNYEFQDAILGLDEIANKSIDRSLSYFRILLAFDALKRGSNFIEICKYLDWKDFEMLSSEILKWHNFDVILNYRLRSPTRQIDVIGKKLSLALIIDCKHWRRNSYSALFDAVKKQKERGMMLYRKKSLKGITKVSPLIVTFVPIAFGQVDGVPIVPIQLLNSFLLDFEFHIEKYFTI